MQTSDQQIAALKRDLATHLANGDSDRADAARAKLAKLRGESGGPAPDEAEPAPRTRRAK